jgi:hypothetical protein
MLPFGGSAASTGVAMAQEAASAKEAIEERVVVAPTNRDCKLFGNFIMDSWSGREKSRDQLPAAKR